MPYPLCVYSKTICTSFTTADGINHLTRRTHTEKRRALWPSGTINYMQQNVKCTEGQSVCVCCGVIFMLRPSLSINQCAPARMSMRSYSDVSDSIQCCCRSAQTHIPADARSPRTSRFICQAIVQRASSQFVAKILKMVGCRF